MQEVPGLPLRHSGLQEQAPVRGLLGGPSLLGMQGTPPEVLARRRGASELRKHEDPDLPGDQSAIPSWRPVSHPAPGRRPPRQHVSGQFRGPPLVAP
eukprot:4556794-Alexandrium_andersonii.AAC.1